MSIQVDINSEDVQAAVVQAITNSTIGQTVSDQIKKHFTGYQSESFWSGVVAKEIEKVAAQAVAEEIRNQQEVIIKAVKEQMGDEMVRQLVAKTFEQVWDR